jgi:hypothetical protein
MYSPKKIAFMSILKNVKHQTAICSFMKTVHTENDGKFCFRCNFYNFVIIDSEHRELYSNMGMRMQHTICLMMRLKSFRPEVDKSWLSRRECQK